MCRSASANLCRPDPACRELDERAEQAFRNKDYAGAITASKAAYAIKQEPRFILNIGRYHHKLGQYEEALTMYRKYAELDPSPEPSLRETRDRFVREAEAALQAQRAGQGKPQALDLKADGSTTKTPVYKKWWFWTVIGVAVAAGVAGGVAGGLASREPFSTTH